MKMEHERKWRVPFGRVKVRRRWVLIGDLYLPEPAGGPALRLRKELDVSAAEALELNGDEANEWLRGADGVIVAKLGEGLSRAEYIWPFDATLAFNPQGLKLRAEADTPAGVLSVDRYLRPRIASFEILELEGELDAVKAWTPPEDWEAVEVTGDKAYGNERLMSGVFPA